MSYDARRGDVQVLGPGNGWDDDLDIEGWGDAELGFGFGDIMNIVDAATNPIRHLEALTGVDIPDPLVAVFDPSFPVKLAKKVAWNQKGKGKQAAKKAAQKTLVAAQTAQAQVKQNMQPLVAPPMAQGAPPMQYQPQPVGTPPAQATPQMYGAPPSGPYGGAPYAGPSSREVVGLGTGAFGAAGTTLTFTVANIGKPIRVERLIIQAVDDGAVAAGLEVVDILSIGVDSQLAGTLGIPIEAFQPTAQSGVVLAGGWWTPGVTLTLRITRTAAPGAGTDVLVSAAIFGQTSRSNAWATLGQQG